MKTLPLAIWTASLLLALTASAGAVEIKSASVGAPSKANLCRQLGGQDKDPVLTIKHDKKAGDTISVRMYDVLSNGRVFEHRSKRIKSEADGTTVLTANFLAPCNTTGGRRNSSYRFDITSKGSKTVTVRWFKYNSATGEISR
ncbi:MAG: hypothetical protein KDJ16_04925 [Hyphomicrobiales bacterium]|nr:hypothetical protein [Hyphomicrobiales bacterium]